MQSSAWAGKFEPSCRLQTADLTIVCASSASGSRSTGLDFELIRKNSNKSGDKFVLLSDRLSILNDTERAVVDTITMKLQPTEAVSYLNDCGFKMVKRTYFRYKKKVESLKWERLKHAANLFTQQHLDRMDKLELIEQLMWKCYQEEKSAYKKSCILEKIANLQPFISNYYDATTYVLKCRMKTDVIAEKEKQEFTVAEKSTLKRLTPFSGIDYDNYNQK